MDSFAAVVPDKQVIMKGPNDRIGRCEDRLPLLSAGVLEIWTQRGGLERL
jgi:hypothetical protein